MNIKMKTLSIVVSVFNEEEVIDKFYDAMMNVLKTISWSYEIIYVNDGSSDHSYEKLCKIAEDNTYVKIINFSRNFGHEAAMIAGIDYSHGDAVVCMDADLQHPVEKIPEIIEALENGAEVITMKRTSNASAGLLKNITSALFYKILNKMSSVKFEENASDFFAISQIVSKILKNEYREKVRFLRGYVQSAGFNKVTIEYQAKERQGGKSKYNLKKLLAFSLNALFSFSDTPLKFAGICGLVTGAFGIGLMIYSIVKKIFWGAPSGYSTIIVVLCFMFAILFVLLGVVGEYIGIIFAEIKNRPIYIVKDTENMNEDIC